MKEHIRIARRKKMNSVYLVEKMYNGYKRVYKVEEITGA